MGGRTGKEGKKPPGSHCGGIAALKLLGCHSTCRAQQQGGFWLGESWHTYSYLSWVKDYS